MRFPVSVLDDIRAALPVSSVLGRHMKLRRQGREHIGLSPFKHEKTPSFTVNDAKGFYHCFATGEHGDIFDFLTKTQGLSFPEAVERLAAEAGIELPKPAQVEAREAEGHRLRKLMEAACAFFQNALRSDAGAEARTYLERRGVTTTEIDAFRLGFAQDGRHALKEHLAAKGFALEDMIAAGMLVAGKDIPVAYDRFRNRLIFPITDLQGRGIAFGGRALDPGQQPKYLNSPDTPLFRKGAVLFNAARARPAAHERGAVIVAEGYMDVIALTRVGFPNAVAPLGTALTPDQMQMLWRLAPEPLLCFDGDGAGIKAAHRAVETALPLLRPGQSLAFALLPDGLDPDDLLRQRGSLALADAIANPRPLVDMLWAKELAAGPSCDTPERRAGLEKRLAALVDNIADRSVRGHYQAAIHKRLREAYQPRMAMPRPTAPPHASGRHGAPGARHGTSARPQPRLSIPLEGNALLRADPAAMSRSEALLLRMLLDHPWLLENRAEEVAAIGLTSPAAQDLRGRMLALCCEHGVLDAEILRRSPCDAGLARQLDQTNLAMVATSSMTREEVAELWEHRLSMHRRTVELPRELEAAGRALAADFTPQNLLRMQDLRAQMDNR
jgi:DNA primase